jgi:hypothetical protein
MTELWTSLEAPRLRRGGSTPAEAASIATSVVDSQELMASQGLGEGFKRFLRKVEDGSN